MDDGARLWLYKYAQRNFWRVCRFYEFDDLVQDGHMCWAIVMARYKDVKDPGHLMSLFKITYVNHVHDLASKQTLCTEQPFSSFPLIIAEQLADSIGVDEMATMELLIKQAPELVGKIFQLFASEEGLKRLRAPGRETLNTRLCEMLGLDPKKNNLPKLVQSYLAT